MKYENKRDQVVVQYFGCFFLKNTAENSSSDDLRSESFQNC